MRRGIARERTPSGLRSAHFLGLGLLTLGCAVGQGADDAGVNVVADGTSETGDADSLVPDSDSQAQVDAASAPGIDAAAGRPDAAASTCPTSPCDLLEQCGCEATQACDLNPAALPETHCREIDAPGRETDVCSQFEDCAAGYVCVTSDDTNAVCQRYCGDDSDCDAPRGKCAISLVSGTSEIPGAVTCSSNCDPAAATPARCPAGWGCAILLIDPDGIAESGDEFPIADCGVAGTGTQGAACASNADCASGYLCVNALTLQCLRICDNIGSACADAAGTTCGGLVPQIMLGGVEYGICF